MEFCVYFLLLYLLSTADVAQAIIIDECDAAGNADIADSNPNPSLTCSAVDRSLWVTWSLQQPGEIDRRQIGECIYWSLDRPDANCTLERGFQGSGFSMKREGRFTSTLYFNYKQFREGTVIYCATQPTGPSTSCKVFFIEAYKLQDCPNGVIEVPKDGTVNVTCTGMTSSQNMYWTMNFKDKSERRINCPATRTTGTSNCEREYSGATGVRSGNESVLTLSQDGFTYWDSAIVKCSKSDNVTQAELQVNFVSPFRLESCHSHGSLLYVRRDKESFVSCDGPSSSHFMYWTVELRNGTVRRTDCAPYKTHDWTCPPNEIEGFTGHRFSSGSYSLELTDNDGDNNTYLDGAVVTCSSQFNVSRDQCDIKVTWEPVGTLKLDNSTCPSLVITETDATESDVRCRCFLDPSDQLGSPAALVTWFTPFKEWINQELVYSDLLSQSGQEYAAGYSVLHDGNFYLADNGSVFTHYCRLEWYGSLSEGNPQVLQELKYTLVVYVNPASSSPHVAAIVGGVVGAVVLIVVIAIIIVVFFVRKRG